MATPIPNNVAVFQLRDVLAATGGTLAGQLAGEAVLRGVCTDTRAIQPEQLFVALTGERFDGHAHLEAAARAGAALALVEQDVGDAPLPVVRVASTLDALGALAAVHLKRWRGRVAVLTGSAGKTTTKTVLGALVEAVAPGQVWVTQGNLNNRVGVPMTVFGLLPAHRYAVLELGTNQPGEIAALGRIARADVGLLTLIASAHTEGLGSIDAVAVEKSAIFRELGESAVGIGNVDDERVSKALAEATVSTQIGYGAQAHATYRITARELTSPRAQRISLSTPRAQLSFTAPLLGAAGALACAGALAASDALVERRLAADEIEAALAGAGALLSDRMCPSELGDGTWLIDDSYNANPASCRASIATAKELATHLRRRLVLVLGEMRELGSVSVAEHRELAAATAGAALVICVGGDAEHTYRAATVPAVFAADATAAAEVATARVQPGDVVLVKGSRGVRTERVVAALKEERA